jgi:predicted transcriptional regulator
MKVHFTPEQEAELTQAAGAEGVDPEAFVKGATLRLLDDARFRAAVREAIAQADRGEFVPEEEVDALFDQILCSFERGALSITVIESARFQVRGRSNAPSDYRSPRASAQVLLPVLRIEVDRMPCAFSIQTAPLLCKCLSSSWRFTTSASSLGTDVNSQRDELHQIGIRSTRFIIRHGQRPSFLDQNLPEVFHRTGDHQSGVG